MDTFWSFGSLELDQFVERKKFLSYKFLKTRIMQTEPKLAKVRTLPSEYQWNAGIFFNLCL